MKNFVKAMDQEGDGFKFLKDFFGAHKSNGGKRRWIICLTQEQMNCFRILYRTHRCNIGQQLLMSYKGLMGLGIAKPKFAYFKVVQEG